MPNSLKCKIKHICYNGTITERERDRILKALDQESILSKIRTEIEGYKSTISRAISEDELKIEGMKEAYTDCIKIIDKYKIESSEE